MPEPIALGRIAELARGVTAGSAGTIAAVAQVAQRLSGVDITVVSEITADGRYVFRGLESTGPIPVSRDDAIPYAASLCSRIHAGESPATVVDTRDVPALRAQWLRLKEQLGVAWDVDAFCTREILLPDATRFGTICFHHRSPRSFSDDEQALLEVLARLVGQEVARERAAHGLDRATHALAEAERLRVELAEELRHELRAPLQVIDGYGEAMIDGVVAPTPEHLALVRGEAARAMRLLDDIIDLTRLETEPAASPPEPVDLAVAAGEMARRLAPLARAEGVTITTALAPVVVAADRRRLEQLVVNLVRNAIRAASGGAGSSVVLATSRDGAEAVVTVSDDGPGIPPEELPRIFERFYRGASERDARTGSGLGLTIARRIVDDLRGTIDAAARPGGGTEMVVRLPAREGVADAPHPGSEEPGG